MTAAAPPPLDPVAVAAARAPFGQSRMLPGAAYADPAVTDWEREHFFDGGWVCAGRATDLATPGDQRAVRIGRTAVLLTRDAAGALHAFANICRHRGHELLPCGATATRSTITCPYHAWAYGLDGALRNAPRFAHDGFDPAAFGLVPLRHHTWGGFVFVNVSGDAPPFGEHAAGLPALLAAWGLDGLGVAATHSYAVEANWKLVHENYQECYHCPHIHPELCRVSVHNSGDNVHAERGAWVGGTMELSPHATTMSLDGASGGEPIEGLDERQRRTVTYVALLPNLLVSAHPDYVLTHRLEPLDAGTTRVECQWLFPPAATGRPGFDPAYAVDFWDVVNRQDWHAIESVQRAMRSPAYVPGVLAPHEDAVYDFVAMIARGYSGLPLAADAKVRV